MPLQIYFMEQNGEYCELLITRQMFLTFNKVTYGNDLLYTQNNTKHQL